VPLTMDEFSAKFRDFAESAFRLESRQDYTTPAEQPKLERFLAGESEPIEPNSSWRSLISEKVGAGMRWDKVKVVRRPLTDYQRFALAWGVPANERAGELHRILDVTDRDVGLPEIDFWIFDDATVVVLHYYEDGTLDHLEEVPPADIGSYRRWRDIAMRESVPLSEYRT